MLKHAPMFRRIAAQANRGKGAVMPKQKAKMNKKKEEKGKDMEKDVEESKE